MNPTPKTNGIACPACSKETVKLTHSVRLSDAIRRRSYLCKSCKHRFTKRVHVTERVLIDGEQEAPIARPSLVPRSATLDDLKGAWRRVCGSDQSLFRYWIESN